jgi:hypothetical protein
MRTVAILWVVATASCGASGQATVTATTNVEVGGTTTGARACQTAYVDYEARWRLARTEELEEFVAGDPAVLEEILYYELGSLPSRVELTKLREIYAVVDAFLWNAPWPRALAAAETAIEQCGEQTPRPA